MDVWKTAIRQVSFIIAVSPQIPELYTIPDANDNLQGLRRPNNIGVLQHSIAYFRDATDLKLDRLKPLNITPVLISPLTSYTRVKAASNERHTWA